jgi:hypothetical protein
MKAPLVREETTEISMGSVTLDAAMARRHGWSAAQLERAWSRLRAIARRENALSHRAGPVKGCPCVVCDPKVPDGLTDNARCRASWRRRGLWRGGSR